MLQAAGSLTAIALLVAVGVVMARRGLLGDRAVDGLKALITRLTLPLLLFRAFLQLAPDGRNAVLALAVFAACAVMGVIGAGLSRALRLPRPETRLLFQGFEAGMLGYALFVALHGDERLAAFAALDMGQVVFVFTALLVQMSVLEQRQASGSAISFPWRDIARSAVLWAIAAGLTLSLAAPGPAATLSGPDGFAAPVFDTIGGLTTPLVCLVIGASLAGGVPRDPAIVTVVAARTLVGLGLGLVFGLLVVPALGFDAWHTKAAVMLFVLPAPFVIPVYHRRQAAFVGSVLTLSTAVSIALIAALAVLGVA
ncbi:hypothetical protein Q6348_07405 [Isoptericola sp. b441]|uniref:Uncharacterized protein n=1 Tax=Actinotalea lenta TaxID=3064654 RepID=A0ABT9D824_9CELL|nr:hypothetical protein [Isoptericola sp. b441]MDO8107024.1 hypothetical protein [Isoptericola sp. b441]